MVGGVTSSRKASSNVLTVRELGAVFKRWYSGMDIEVEEMPAAA
jgi:hypothetical protein